jgi:hypothetical protein
MGQADARVPSGPFDDRTTGSNAAFLFCILKDPDGGTILDAPPWVLKLGFAKYMAACLFRERFEIN